MMLNIKVQRLKCYHNKKIKTEKLRNTNMLDKCRSPDLAPSDYFLIRNLKYRLYGTRFTDDESMKITVEAWFESQNSEKKS